MGTPRPVHRRRPNEPTFAVSKLQLEDIQDYIVLQDLFCEEHLALTREVYKQVGLRDWQLSLICPPHILDKDGGREKHIEGMVKQDEECFRSLTILKASTQVNGGPPFLVGYIMYQIHDRDAQTKRRGPGHKRARVTHGEASPWVQVKQIFVRRSQRQLGCGTVLFNSMLGEFGRLYEGMDPGVNQDIRLSVVDLNTVATHWYRAQGFRVVNLSRELLGPPEEINVVVFQEMRRRLDVGGQDLGVGPVHLLFKRDVIHEEIRINYPDGSGSYDVKVVGYSEKERWHYVDSRGLSLWEGQSFTDEINLNEFFSAGYIQFKRHLSLVQRDVDLTRREWRRATKAEASARAEGRCGVLQQAADKAWGTNGVTRKTNTATKARAGSHDLGSAAAVMGHRRM